MIARDSQTPEKCHVTEGNRKNRPMFRVPSFNLPNYSSVISDATKEQGKEREKG